MEKVDKLYSLNNSYFKNKKDHYPETMLDIVSYWDEHKELPFSYSGENWVYDTMCERQKKRGIVHSQYLTPDAVAEQIAELADNFNPEGMCVLNACCGIGQLTRQLAGHGFNVTGFDSDPEMVKICRLLYSGAEFNECDYRTDKKPVRRELVVANPPHDKTYLLQFMEWLSSALTASGKAILILPKDYLRRDKPDSLVKILRRFECKHEEPLKDRFLHTSTEQEIYVMELSEAYVNLIGLAITGTGKDVIESAPEVCKTKIMETKDNVHLVPLSSIRPNPDNPRKKIKDEDIRELAQSILKSGLLQAITLRERNGFYEIVIGERRCLAFMMNGQSEIPAYIRDLSDTQVMEIALAENLLRKDLTPLEESDAFQRFLETGKYTIENLCSTFGKAESFIRGRLRLQNLTYDFRLLLDNEIITLGAGQEIAKYDPKTQDNLHKEHFAADDNTNWKDLGIKELAGRIERAYTTELSKYKFDKAECNSCLSNTGTYNLFSGPESGRCTNAVCLQKKRTEFTMSFCKVIADKHENIDVCIAPYDKLDETTNEELGKQGINVVTTIAESYPQAPETPTRENYKTDKEYSEAMEEHKIEIGGYNKEIEEIEEKIERGELKKVIYIGDNNPKLCYIPVKADSRRDPVRALDEEDAANKREAANGVIKELSQLLQTCGLPPSGFSEFEEQMLVFFMLDSLNIKHYAIFGIKETNMKGLPDDLKYKISKSVTADQKAIIQRDFLIRHLVKAADSNSKSLLMIGFSRQHFPQETTDISSKYTTTYNTKYQRLKKQREAITNKVEV